MTEKQTTQRGKTTTTQASSKTKTENATPHQENPATAQVGTTNITKQGRPTKQPNKKTSPKNHKAKFYDDVLNCRLRELMDGREARTEELANAVGIGSSAVRMWYTGYARPDIDKIPAICKFYGVSADWLLGLSEAQSVSMEFRQISEETGLTDQALLNLTSLNNVPKHLQAGDGIYSYASAKEMLWLINRFIEETKTVYTIADKANAYVNIRNTMENFDILDYNDEDYGSMDVTGLMKQGLEKFGMTFNFTYGQETMDYLAYVMQKEFLGFVGGIGMPAWVVRE